MRNFWYVRVRANIEIFISQVCELCLDNDQRERNWDELLREWCDQSHKLWDFRLSGKHFLMRPRACVFVNLHIVSLDFLLLQICCLPLVTKLLQIDSSNFFFELWWWNSEQLVVQIIPSDAMLSSLLVFLVRLGITQRCSIV